jgi:putative Holliday junction resolvase
VGVALSDALRITARPAGAVQVRSSDEAAEAIAALALEHEVTAVVVGLPLNMDGSRGPMAEEAEAFAALVKEKTGLSVHAWDERLSSKQADKAMLRANLSRKKRKKRIDGLAAQIVLQSWLDAQGVRHGEE